MDYLVVWCDDGDVIQSRVNLGICDPRQANSDTWVWEAAKSEGYTDAEVCELLNSSYSLYLVCPFPEIMYV